MQYDGYDPFGFAPSDGEVKIKKYKRKKRTMASIYQYKALSDISNCAKAKENSTLEGVDKELHSEGVRPGQVWKVPHGSDLYYLSFIGYHEKGFLMLNLRAEEASPLPPVSLFKYPRKIKMDLLANIKAKEAALLTAATPNLLDKYGEALPNREMDVTLAALMARPAFWHDYNKNRNYFLSICKDGHHRVSIGYLPSGIRCDQFCFNAQHTEAMAFLSDIILDKVYYGKNSNHGFYIRNSESRSFSNATTAWTYIESIYETYKIIEANKTGAQRNKIIPEGVAQEEDDWRLKTKNWLTKNEIRSGMVFHLAGNHSGQEEIKARLHIKICGNLHVELTNNDIFSGEDNGNLIKQICESSDTPSIRLSNKTKIKLHGEYPFIKCPNCNSGHILCINEEALHPNKEKIKNITPVVMNNPRPKTIASPGEIIKYHGEPALYLKERKKREGELGKIMILKKDKRITTVYPTQIRALAQTNENKEIFFDQDKILKKNFSIGTWYKLVVPGSKIKIHPLIQNEKLKNLAGFTVTVVDFPFETDGRPSVGIIESDSIVRLDTDVLPCNTFPIESGMPITIDKEYYVIGNRNLNEGTINLLNENGELSMKVPEAGLHLAFNRNKAELYRRDTVDNILKHL